jgi:hypothetical protein
MAYNNSFFCLDMKTTGSFQTLVLLYANNCVTYQQAMNFIFTDKRTSKKVKAFRVFLIFYVLQEGHLNRKIVITTVSKSIEPEVLNSVILVDRNKKEFVWLNVQNGHVVPHMSRGF